MNNQNISTDYLKSDIGLIEITASNAGVSSVYFVEEVNKKSTPNEHTINCKDQLNEYFTNQRQRFDLPLDLFSTPKGTDFQQQVWKALLTIPYGKVASYADIAVHINNPKAVRAVGAANGKNPISIIVPCHRVIGANGTLTGYAGGLERKQWLLQHESREMFKV